VTIFVSFGFYFRFPTALELDDQLTQLIEAMSKKVNKNSGIYPAQVSLNDLPQIWHTKCS